MKVTLKEFYAFEALFLNYIYQGGSKPNICQERFRMFMTKTDLFFFEKFFKVTFIKDTKYFNKSEYIFVINVTRTLFLLNLLKIR